MNPQICPSAYDPKRNGEKETASKLIENRIKHEREMSQQVEGRCVRVRTRVHNVYQIQI